VALKNENVAWLVMLGFGVAASAIFPAMVTTLWWRRLTRQGMLAGIISGLTVSIIFIVMLLTGVDTFLGMSTAGGPGIFGVTVSFLMLFTVSMLTKDTGKNVEEFFALAHRPDTD